MRRPGNSNSKLIGSFAGPIRLTVPEKIKAVEQLFSLLDQEVNDFQGATGLHCASGCGKCCFKADVESTILEFLPLAWQLYQEGVAADWMAKLKTNLSPICVNLSPSSSYQGRCSNYAHRGLICRLFGYSARRDKHGKAQFVTCTVIKSEQKELYEAAVAGIDGGLEIPLMTNYFMRLHGIDADLSREFYPINVAIRKALEVVLMHFSYRHRHSA